MTTIIVDDDHDANKRDGDVDDDDYELSVGYGDDDLQGNSKDYWHANDRHVAMVTRKHEWQEVFEV